MVKFYVVRDVYTGEWFAADEEDRGKALSNLRQWPPKDEMREKQFQAWLSARVVNAQTVKEALAQVADTG